MRTEIKQTAISCDVCSKQISTPLSEPYTPTQVINYLNWKEFDLCTKCCMKILRSLLTEKKVTSDELSEAINTFKNYNYAPRGGVVLC